MKMHVTLTVIAMFFASGTALAQNSVHNPHEWGNEAALATTAQEPRIAREAGTGLAQNRVRNPHEWGNEAALATTAQEPRTAREAGSGLVEAVQEPAKGVVLETDTIGLKAVLK